MIDDKRKQSLVDAKISKLLLRQRLSKSRKPHLINAIVHKIEGLEGIKVSRRIYSSE